MNNMTKSVVSSAMAPVVEPVVVYRTLPETSVITITPNVISYAGIYRKIEDNPEYILPNPA